MKITTLSGSVYTINDHGICVKTDKDGKGIDAFKVFVMKPIRKGVSSWREIHEAPKGNPEVGKALYIGGLNSWWLTTEVFSIEYNQTLDK